MFEDKLKFGASFPFDAIEQQFKTLYKKNDLSMGMHKACCSRWESAMGML